MCMLFPTCLITGVSTSREFVAMMVALRWLKNRNKLYANNVFLLQLNLGLLDQASSVTSLFNIATCQLALQTGTDVDLAKKLGQTALV